MNKKPIYCVVCEDYIDRSELRIWSGDDRRHYLCPGCGSDLLPDESIDEDLYKEKE